MGHSPAKADGGNSGACHAACAKNTVSAESAATPPLSANTLHGQFPPRSLVTMGAHVKELLSAAKGPTLSASTARFGRLDKLHKTIDHTITKIGSAALLRDILRPPNDVRAIEARREAIQELKENKELRSFLEQALTSTARKFFRGMSIEDTALTVLAPELADHSIKKLGFFGLLGRAGRVMLNTHYEMCFRISSLGKIVRSVEGCPTPKSPLLRGIVGEIQQALTSPHVELLDGKAVATTKSIEARGSVRWDTPAFRIHGKLFNVEDAAVLSMYGLISAASYISKMAGDLKMAADMILQPMLVFTGLIFILRGFVVTMKTPIKFQERVAKEPEVLRAIDNIGRLDALLSLATFEESMGDKVCTPVLRDQPGYNAEYKSMKHPVVALEEKGCVANDVSLEAGKVFVLTGPNSGGKTTIATALLQNQILAHLGTRVFAESATLSVADRMLYQGPTFKTLGEHGKFGTELKATRKVFMKATERSLVVLDEVGDGTNAEEGIRQTSAVLWGFKKLGSGTVVITHNRDLVRQLKEKEIGVAYQMNTSEGKPDFNLLPGISPYSHANAVAKELRFSPKEIRAIVQRKLRKRRRESGRQ